jgi:uncharacterized membrane protein YgcG
LEKLKTLRRIFHSFDGKEINFIESDGSNSTEVKCYARYDGKDTLYFNNCEDEDYNGYMKVGLSKNGTLSITDDENDTFTYVDACPVGKYIKVKWIEDGTTYIADIYLPSESEGESESGSNSEGDSGGSGSHSGGGS